MDGTIHQKLKCQPLGPARRNLLRSRQPVHLNICRDTHYVYHLCQLFSMLSCKFIHFDAVRVLACIFLVVSCAKCLLQPTAFVDKPASSYLLQVFPLQPCFSSSYHSVLLGQQLILEARSNHCQCLHTRTACAIGSPDSLPLRTPRCGLWTERPSSRRSHSHLFQVLCFFYSALPSKGHSSLRHITMRLHVLPVPFFFPPLCAAAKGLTSPQILSAWICCA